MVAHVARLHQAAWPRFVQADPAARRHWGDLLRTFADFQLLLCGEAGQVIAAGHSIPVVWDGTVAGLPAGWDAVLEQGIREHEEGRAPTTLAALAIVVDPAHQGQGHSKIMLQAMRAVATKRGLGALIAPVRPTLKARYPLTPMERYVRWREADGAPFDPWLRVHWRLGGEFLSIAPRSMVITGTVAEWEAWTAMRFPESGR
ncbi:MAG: GNAT family N-acetyltransferase, partial [Chloroflexota bacterium]